MNDNNLDEKKKWAAYSTVGLMFPTSIAVGFFMGYLLDKVFKTSPYLLIIFTLYGIAAGFVNLYKVTKKYGKKKQ
jgi:ATP synthase protein I